MIRVLIVEDDPLIAQAHREFTGRVTGFEVVGAVGTGNGAVRIVAAAARFLQGSNASSTVRPVFAKFAELTWPKPMSML